MKLDTTTKRRLIRLALGLIGFLVIPTVLIYEMATSAPQADFFIPNLSLQGTLETQHYDNFETGQSGYLYYMNVPGNVRFQVRYTNPSISQRLITASNATVRVEGQVLGNNIIVKDDNPANITTIQPAPRQNSSVQNAGSPINIAVLVVNQTDMNGWRNHVNTVMKPYLQEVTYGAPVTIDVYGPINIAGPSNPNDQAFCLSGYYNFELAAKAEAQRQGVPINNYYGNGSIMVTMPYCTGWYSGISPVGGPIFAVNTSSIGLLSNQTSGVHEFGHAKFKYSHAGSCNPTNCASNYSDQTDSRSYGDGTDAMGSFGNTGHYSAWRKETAGLMNTVQDINNTSGNYTLNALEHQSSGTQALRLRSSTPLFNSSNPTLYVEYRDGSGFDYGMQGIKVYAIGLSINNNPNNQDLSVNIGTNTYLGAGQLLKTGQSYQDARGLVITNAGMSGGTATVQVTFPGSQPPPSPTPIPSTPSSPTPIPSPSTGPSSNPKPWYCVYPRYSNLPACKDTNPSPSPIVPSPVVSPSPSPSAIPSVDPSPNVGLDPEEQAFLTIINNYRVQNGRRTLKISPTLQQSSKWMANDLATHSNFSHIDSLGRSFSDRLRYGFNYPWGAYENIARWYDSAQSVFTAWKNSTIGHNENMLQSNTVVVGIARVNGPYGMNWVTDFGVYDDSGTNPSPSPIVSPSFNPIPSPSLNPIPSPSVIPSTNPNPRPWYCNYLPHLPLCIGTNPSPAPTYVPPTVQPTYNPPSPQPTRKPLVCLFKPWDPVCQDAPAGRTTFQNPAPIPTPCVRRFLFWSFPC